MAGPLKTLFQALQASVFMSGISLAFGEESIDNMMPALPYIVMVPLGGVTTEPGYAMDGSTSPGVIPPPQYIDTYVDNLWEVSTQVEFYVWAEASSNLPIDNADAVETVRLALLSALRDQRAQSNANGDVFYGLSWKPVREDWRRMQNAVARAGKALVVTVQIDVPVVMAPPTAGEVTVETTQFTPSINNQPG